MAVNDMTIEQVSTVLNAIVEQATGKQPTIQVTDTSSFVTVAQTALKTGYDTVLQAISQVLSRTIFSVRPYNRKFRGIEVSTQKWGNHVRKLQLVDNTFENDERYSLTEGQSVDMYKVKKPKPVQTNFYGQITFQDHITIFRDQLDVAFSSPTEFASFISMIMQNMSDRFAQMDEEFDRSAVANFIGGKIIGNTDVIHLVTEYNAYAGTSYTATTIKDPTAYEPFIKWVFGRIKTLVGMMSERSIKYHTNLTDKPLMRHTPVDNLKMYLFAPVLNDITSSVLSDIYNDELLRFAEHEEVSYWQNIDNPDKLKLTASYMTAAGAITTGSVDAANIFGVLFDEEAVGSNRCNEWSERTPMNAAGGYSNIYWHWTRRYWNDFTENGLVLMLD
jgi:hypothetical protein